MNLSVAVATVDMGVMDLVCKWDKWNPGAVVSDDDGPWLLFNCAIATPNEDRAEKLKARLLNIDEGVSVGLLTWVPEEGVVPIRNSVRGWYFKSAILFDNWRRLLIDLTGFEGCLILSSNTWEDESIK